jgi:hypothetical protein
MPMLSRGVTSNTAPEANNVSAGTPASNEDRDLRLEY